MLGKLDDTDLIDEVRMTIGQSSLGREIKLVGSIQERKLVDSIEWPLEKHVYFSIPDINAWKGLSLEAFTILDDGPFNEYSQGSVVFVTPFVEGKVEPKHRDLVVFADYHERSKRFEVFLGKIIVNGSSSFSVGSLHMQNSLKDEIEERGGYMEAGFIGLVVGGIAVENTSRIAPSQSTDPEDA